MSANKFKVAPFRVFYKRSLKTNSGVMTIQDTTGKPVVFNGVEFRRLLSLSGSVSQSHTNWVTGRSPIPLDVGPMYLWLKPVGLGLKPGSRGIGEAWPISNDLNNIDIVRGKNPGQLRTLIRLHLDNAIPGSAGCIVLPYELAPKSRKAAAQAVLDWLNDLRKQGYDYIPLDVIL